MFEFTKEKINSLLSIDEFHDYFEQVSNREIVEPPYNDENYFNYTAANFKRGNKIRKKIDLDKKLYNELNDGIDHWTWILITEPWCGDSSFSQPIIEAISLAGGLELKIALRDKEEEMINTYLTCGGKSIPKLVVIDDQYKEVFQWGPRPVELQKEIVNLVSNDGTMEDKIKLAYKWYRKYGNDAVQQELFELIKKNK